jgi:hypothetical protein
MYGNPVCKSVLKIQAVKLLSNVCPYVALYGPNTSLLSSGQEYEGETAVVETYSRSRPLLSHGNVMTILFRLLGKKIFFYRIVVPKSLSAPSYLLLHPSFLPYSFPSCLTFIYSFLYITYEEKRARRE